MPTPRTPLAAAVRTLTKLYGSAPAPFPIDPFEIILWENAAYLADDDRRRGAFELLRREIGTRPEQILAASPAQLRRVTAHGILSDQFAEKLQQAARLALEKCGGDLDQVVRRPLPEAKKILRLFPGIGEPGAEKILLFTGRQPLLAPDSNALRVLVRLGIAPEKPSYSATYTAARQAAEEQLGRDLKLHFAAHQLLRRHGLELCRRSVPACDRCPLVLDCQFGSRQRTGGDKLAVKRTSTRKQAPGSARRSPRS